jgi:hypothetical protein
VVLYVGYLWHCQYQDSYSVNDRMIMIIKWLVE